MILVTGGGGYLGRALVAGLLGRGEKVRVFGRNGNRALPGAEAFAGDISSPGQLAVAMQGVRVVYHLAALVDHYATEAELYRVNVQGSVNVVEAAIRHGVQRFVHCSSVSAEPGGGSTAYGRSKIAAEQRLAVYQEQLPIIILRPGPVYDEERSNLRRLVKLATRLHWCPVLRPDVAVHLASRANVTDAFLLAAEAGQPGQAYAVCDRDPVSRAALAEIICAAAGSRLFSLPLKLLSPLVAGTAQLCEGLHAAFGVRPLIDRHYLRVLTRERRYDIQPACDDLGYRPARTEDHFARAVREVLLSQRRLR